MAWYHDKGRSTFVATYKDEESMLKEVEEAAKHGWIPQNTAGTGGHINVGRTAARVALTGGVGLLFGASRSKDKITITFVRSESSVALNQIDQANRAVMEHRGKAARSGSEAKRLSATFRSLLEASDGTSELNREDQEKNLSKALKASVDAGRSEANACQELMNSLTQLSAAQTRAEAIGTQLGSPPIDLDRETNQLMQQLEAASHRLADEERIREIQERIVGQAKAWREASEKHGKAQRRVDDADRSTAQAREALDGATPDRAPRLETKLREAEAEEAKRRGELQQLSGALTEQTTVLQAMLQERRETAAEQDQAGVATVDFVDSPQRESRESNEASEEVQKIASSSADIPGQIERLAELHRSGVLTDGEFSSKKADLLARM